MVSLCCTYANEIKEWLLPGAGARPACFIVPSIFLLGTIRNMVSWCLAKAATDADSLQLTSRRKEEPLERSPLLGGPHQWEGDGWGGGGAAGTRHRSDSGSKQDSAATLVHIYHCFSKQLKPHLPEGHFSCAVN